MLEILRDQVWEFVGGVFLGLVAIIVTIILWRTQRRRKALSYEIISRTPLLSVEDEVKGKVQILFDGNPVQDIHLVVLKIINSGNVPIVSTDYERPVSLSFGENPRILTAEVSETDPDNLEISVDIQATKVMLDPVLLNGGDSITLKFLVSQLDEINIDGRIIGVKDIRKHTAGITANRLRSFGAYLVLAGATLSVVGPVLAMVWDFIGLPPPLSHIVFPSILGGFAMGGVGIVALVVANLLDSMKARQLAQRSAEIRAWPLSPQVIMKAEEPFTSQRLGKLISEIVSALREIERERLKSEQSKTDGQASRSTSSDQNTDEE